MNKAVRYILILCCFAGLVFVRFCESELFYDPFLSFFKRDYKQLPLPEMDLVRYFINVIFRYSINTMLSLFVIWLAFKDTSIVKFSTLLYGATLIILFIPLWVCIYAIDTPNYLAIFYVRRFLLQPLLLFLLLPAFYYYRKVKMR